MRRTLQGSLEHLTPPTLLRLLWATARSGLLELDTPAGTLRLEVIRGRAPAFDDAALAEAGRVLAATRGSFRFVPEDLGSPGEETVGLSALVDAAAFQRRQAGAEGGSDRNSGETGSGTRAGGIHVLPDAPPHNPLEALLEDLEETAPEELLLAEIGVVAPDPRAWRGSLEASWRRRGWRVRLLAAPADVPVDELDALVIHHQLSVTRVGHEGDWLELVRRGTEVSPPVPVVWAGPLGDPAWVHRLIAAGVSFLMPPPQGEAGEVMRRFAEDLTLVVDREVRRRGVRAPGELAGGVAELVDALLYGADTQQAIGSLLQLASAEVARGAVLLVEDTAIRCRAGFGFPLNRDYTALPRGVGLLERVVRSGETTSETDPDSAAARQLARVLGLERLAVGTAIIPLGTGHAVGGLLVVDHEGDPLPEISGLALIARRLGGAVVASLSNR
jgi:hypothetical protein